MKGERRYRARGFGQRNKEETEANWESRRSATLTRRVAWISIGLVGLLIAAGVIWVWSDTDEAGAARPTRAAAARDELRSSLDAATRVARAFLGASAPEERLKWVRHPEEVRGHLDRYPEAARTMPGEIEKVVGHTDQNTAFVVSLANGEARLMETVTTPDGPRIDWDAYARYNTASWEELWSGEVNRATVRIHCEPSTERPEPFANTDEWTGFRLAGPDLPQVLLGFAAVGTARERMMKKIILGSPRYRQRFLLEIVRHEGEDEPLFEIVECLAVGWIAGPRSVEALWAEQGEVE